MRYYAIVPANCVTSEVMDVVVNNDFNTLRRRSDGTKVLVKFDVGVDGIPTVLSGMDIYNDDEIRAFLIANTADWE